jgi:hypothetical protein
MDGKKNLLPVLTRPREIPEVWGAISANSHYEGHDGGQHGAGLAG